MITKQQATILRLPEAEEENQQSQLELFAMFRLNRLITTLEHYRNTDFTTPAAQDFLRNIYRLVYTLADQINTDISTAADNTSNKVIPFTRPHPIGYGPVKTS